MKYFMITSAIVLVTSAASTTAQTAYADTAIPAKSDAATVASTNIPGFRASEFIGKDLHTLNPDVMNKLRETRAGDPSWDEQSSRWTSGEALIAARDKWENIGAINDIVMSQNGQVQGVLLDIGGFLGIGAHTVLVDTDDLYFVANTDPSGKPSEFFVVASLSREQLKNLPQWKDEKLQIGYAPIAVSVRNDTAAAVTPPSDPGVISHPVITSAPDAPSAQELTGASVNDSAGASIGKVRDLTLDGDKLIGAVIDVGGFLGIGSKSVIVPIDTLTVIRKEDHSIVRIETSLTRKQLDALPKHAG
ncbi:PRC-barrel domain-containing protein [Castellaniella sp.]|uniref:PRC-barrel domain-containing protein n=1 Tax=Castellaniella sp. TaxID=1955812 RepID=UPI002AFFA903|nr:PRC-barrel domain-containing protein [Castellaniella sp.]